VKSNPAWTHRRRLVYFSVCGAWAMIVWGSVVFRDGMVASELVRSGTALVTVILTSYVFGAVLDDHWQKDEKHGE
jgi:hypothetical protein